MEPKWSGKAGRYLRVLNWASEYGLSLDMCGREWLLVTPRSARSWATSLEAIEVPRSAWMASWSRPMPCLARGSAMSRSARAADSGVGDHPPDRVTTEDVQDRVQVEVGPLGRAEQLGDVPGPHAVGCVGDQLGLDRGRVGGRPEPLAPLPLGVQQPVHRGDRGEVAALVEQGGVDLGRG